MHARIAIFKVILKYVHHSHLFDFDILLDNRRQIKISLTVTLCCLGVGVGVP